MLRKAIKADISGISALILENLDTLLRRKKSEIEGLIDTTWVVVEDNKIVGCCILEVYSPKIAEVRSVAVKAGFRGRGLGRQLVDAALEEAKKRKVKQVLAVTSNPEWFKQLNFGPCLNEKFALFWNGTDAEVEENWNEME